MAAAAPPDSTAPAQPAAPPARRERRPRGKRLKWIIAALVILVAALFAVRWWLAQSRFVSTDDAYVGANQVQIAAQVSGPVSQVFVRDQQMVKQGDALFQIDPQPYRIALDQARANLELARQNVSQEGAGVASAEAVLAQRRAEESNAKSTWQRNEALVKSGFISPQAAEQSRTGYATAQAATRAAEADVAKAKSALGKTGDENAAIQAAAAAVEQAQLSLERTHVVAPASGMIANFTLQPGNTVQPGQPLFVVIANDEWWVDANFKETQLVDIRPGEHATVESDMYPHRVFHGVVQSVAGGSGSAFSLLPPQNATGNWVKVTQRVPVRVRIEDPDPQHPLRIGTSATVKVDKPA
ncbi:MAG TPA: HlyD family secretion protein [Usitatibacter sp.]|nr:HlyD family secretion protein [Usitatibacter sp.]